MFRWSPGLAAALLGVVAGAAAPARGQTGAARTVWDGVYSDAQARRGLTVYQQRCISCHGEMLDGANVASALVGDDFMGDWKNKTAADLVRKTQLTMPGDDPGSLMPAQVVDAIAYVFSKNGFPAGTAELPVEADSLKLIRIVPQK